jgi:feruloyl esterase
MIRCILVLVGVLVVSPAAAQGGGAVPCTIEALQSKAPAGTTITAATVVAAAASLPQYCQVDASVATPGNTVNFRLGLPASWNNKFYFEGVGGFAGTIGSLRAGLERGYASASTDTGHQGAVTDASWALNNPAKELDFAHRGTHVTAVAAKALSSAYYGSAPRHAYFSGCSNGGRQALLEAQRYPGDFDGIVAVNPSFGTLGQIQRALIFQALFKSPNHVLPPAKVKLLSEAVVASCDAHDGLADGLISDPRACTFRPETLACKGADGPDCLTAGQIETVKAIYADVRGPEGIVLRGFPMGHEDGATGWQQWITGATPPAPQADGGLAFSGRPPLGFAFADGYLRYLSFPEDDPNFDLRTFSFERHGSKLQASIEAFSPTNPDLAPFRKAGGKLVVVHGWSDPGLSAAATIAYYDEVVKAAGGRQQSDQFVKLFMAPGMHHCPGNGPGPNTFDMLTALEQWVEDGVAPSRVIASHATRGVVDRTRPLCAYPQVARYVGRGNVDAAENFRCETPAAATQQK